MVKYIHLSMQIVHQLVKHTEQKTCQLSLVLSMESSKDWNMKDKRTRATLLASGIIIHQLPVFFCICCPSKLASLT